MPVNDELGKRMKEYYEAIPKTKLMRRVPVALRIDGKAFHTFTRGFEKPFDSTLMKAMGNTLQHLCMNIQGCVFGYTQSDEITLILIDYQTFKTDAWFDYEVQKLCSIGASMATMYFNREFDKAYLEDLADMEWTTFDNYPESMGMKDLARKTGAMFDCRCFNIPKEEVANLLYWRQLDAIRNSIQMCGQAMFSHKQLQNKSCENIKDMMRENGFDWDYMSKDRKYGVSCYKVDGKWILDNETVPFNEDWNFINKHIYVGEK